MHISSIPLCFRFLMIALSGEDVNNRQVSLTVEKNCAKISFQNSLVCFPRYCRERKGRENMGYKAVIFDLDGTLLNTLQDLTDAVNAALLSQGLPQRTLDEIRVFVGNGIKKLLERAVPDGQKNPLFSKVEVFFREYYGKHCQDKTVPYEGIIPLLRQIKEKGIPMAVVSNKADFAVQELIPVYFGDLITSAHGENEKAGIRKKPAPDMVYQTLRELDCKPEETLYVGDSDVDIDTAEQAGLDAVSVSWGFRDRKFLKEHGAVRIIDKPEELTEIIF